MTVYVDDVFIRADVPNGAKTVHGVWCHMTADSTSELNEMAERIGLRKSWIQHAGTWKEHYDLTRTKRALAIRYGAVQVSGREHMRNFLLPRRHGAHPCAPEEPLDLFNF